MGQVTEDGHPHLPPHHVGFSGVEQQLVRRGADWRRPDHVALHLDAFRRRAAGQRAGTNRGDLCASVPAKGRVAVLLLAPVAPSVAQPVAQVAAAVVEVPLGLLFVHHVLGLAFDVLVILIGQTVLRFQRPPAFVAQALFQFDGPAALTGVRVLWFQGFAVLIAQRVLALQRSPVVVDRAVLFLHRTVVLVGQTVFRRGSFLVELFAQVFGG